jgi:type IX secretion system PorP/SprF family membrane protein
MEYFKKVWYGTILSKEKKNLVRLNFSFVNKNLSLILLLYLHTEMKRILLITSILLGISISSFAQLQSNFVQFFNNETYLNPAFAGTQISALNFSAISRTDYTGILNNKLGVSRTLLTFDKRFDEKNFGLAANLNALTFNGLNNFEFGINYSYHLNLGRDRKICMGLKAGGIYEDRGTKLSLREQNDAIYSDTVNFTPKFYEKIGAGFVYKDEKIYAGLAVPDVTNRFNFNVSGGYKFSITEDLYLQPNALVRYIKNQETLTNINCLLGKNESFWAGASYALGNSMAVMGGIHINGRLKLGYAFDYNYNLVYAPTSHEIMLQWDLEDVL